MVALLDKVGAERAVAAGHSLSGYLSLSMLLDHPDRIEALVLIDTGPGFREAEPRDQWNAMAERYAARLDAQGLAGLDAGPEQRSTNTATPPDWPSPPAAFCRSTTRA